MDYNVLNALFHGFIVFALLRILTALYPGKKTKEYEVLPVVYWDSHEYAEGVALRSSEGWEVSAVALSPGQYGNAIFAVVYKRLKK